MKHAVAIEELQIAKDVCDNNAPINEAEGNTDQAALERARSAAIDESIEALKAA